MAWKLATRNIYDKIVNKKKEAFQSTRVISHLKTVQFQ